MSNYHHSQAQEMSRSATMSVMSVTLKGRRLLFALQLSETA